jgi:hypothetical protein
VAVPAISSRCPRKRIPWPRHSRQRFLSGLVRASEELCGSGLCRSCCEAACRSETHVGGLKEDVLARDGRRRRATARRLQALDRHLPPPLVELRREQRPEGFAARLPFDWEARA